MTTKPNPNPPAYRGVEIHCSWPSACFHPDAITPERGGRDHERYVAYVMSDCSRPGQPHERVAGGSLTEIRAEIRRALAG